MYSLGKEEISQALSRGETVGKRLKHLSEIISDLPNEISIPPEIKEEKEDNLDLIKFEAYMLIALRAILMLISAKLTHDLFKGSSL